MFKGLVPIPEGSKWWYLDEATSKGITRELQREIGPRHFLYEWIEDLVAIAKSGRQDDVIVIDTKDPRNLFCVHLTWSGKIDQLPDRFPSAFRIPNADLLSFFIEDSKLERFDHDPHDVYEIVKRALEELEAKDEIVICASGADVIAEQILDKVTAAGLTFTSDAGAEED